MRDATSDNRGFIMTEDIPPEMINNGDVDSGFVDKIVEAGADRLRTCIQCGTCSAVCPSGRRTAFRTREIIRKALLGLKEEVLASSDLWFCSTCYNCLERCPRQIKVTDAILIMRNMAVNHGFMLPEHRKASLKLISTGHAVPIDDANREMRKRLGLKEIPPTAHSNAAALNDVQEILNKTGFKKLIEDQKKEND